MACFKPLEAWQCDGGRVVFTDRGGGRPIQLACGQCVGCRLERSRQWAVRIMHEAKMHERCCFVTLTYDDGHVMSSLDYRDFQLFMKRLRFKCGEVRFFMAGEYGEQFSRPHFHACLFGCDFWEDRKVFKKSESGFTVYTSRLLESLWTSGFSSVADLSFESAAYVARYCLKKVTGDAAAAHYEDFDIRTGEILSKVPEFARMSLKPGIGKLFYDKYASEMMVHDGVMCRGHKSAIPRYYKKKLAEDYARWYSEFEFRQFEQVQANLWDNVPERLAVRETVVKAGLKFKKRKIL